MRHQFGGHLEPMSEKIGEEMLVNGELKAAIKKRPNKNQTHFCRKIYK